MKKSIFLLLISAFFIGCSDDSTTPEPTGNNTSSDGVVGVWNFVSMEQDNGVIKINGNVFSTFTAKSSNEQGTFEFKADGTTTSSVAYPILQLL